MFLCIYHISLVKCCTILVLIIEAMFVFKNQLCMAILEVLLAC